MQRGDGRGSTGSASGSFMVQMGNSPSVWPLPDALPLLCCHDQELHRLHRCAGFPASYSRDFFANPRVQWLLHLPDLLKLSHFPAVFIQAIIPSLIHILHIGSHTDGALQGWTDDWLYLSFLSQCPVPFHCISGAACHHRLVYAVIV